MGFLAPLAAGASSLLGAGTAAAGSIGGLAGAAISALPAAAGGLLGAAGSLLKPPKPPTPPQPPTPAQSFGNGGATSFFSPSQGTANGTSLVRNGGKKTLLGQ